MTGTDVAIQHAWASAHLHFDGALYDASCDQVIGDVVVPAVTDCQRRGLADGFFFVRYSDNGPHVRMRLRRNARVVDDELSAAIAHHARTAGGVPVTLRWVPYEPEVERYGGAAALPESERLFGASSTVVARVLLQLDLTQRPVRLAQGVLALLVLLHAFLPDRHEAMVFLGRYAGGSLAMWQSGRDSSGLSKHFHAGFTSQADALVPLVHRVWALLDAGERTGTAWDDLHDATVAMRQRLEPFWQRGLLFGRDGRPKMDWARARGQLLTSHIHMTSNRLGLTRVEETYVAYLGRRAFATRAPA